MVVAQQTASAAENRSVTGNLTDGKLFQASSTIVWCGDTDDRASSCSRLSQKFGNIRRNPDHRQQKEILTLAQPRSGPLVLQTWARCKSRETRNSTSGVSTRSNDRFEFRSSWDAMRVECKWPANHRKTFSMAFLFRPVTGRWNIIFDLLLPRKFRLLQNFCFAPLKFCRGTFRLSCSITSLQSISAD